ncbi:MAG: hypothetical protein HY787_24035 [Deltaproteobacteria bacterium]|nr:hypothetical protein [Deltaproteobacteria bacterium]
MPLRSLSMTDVLRRLPLPLFTAADAAKLVSDENGFLFPAARKGYLKKIANRMPAVLYFRGVGAQLSRDFVAGAYRLYGHYPILRHRPSKQNYLP